MLPPIIIYSLDLAKLYIFFINLAYVICSKQWCKYYIKVYDSAKPLCYFKTKTKRVLLPKNQMRKLPLRKKWEHKTPLKENVWSSYSIGNLELDWVLIMLSLFLILVWNVTLSYFRETHPFMTDAWKRQNEDSCHVTAVNWRDLEGSGIHPLLQLQVQRNATRTSRQSQLVCWNAKLDRVVCEEGCSWINLYFDEAQQWSRTSSDSCTGALHCLEEYSVYFPRKSSEIKIWVRYASYSDINRKGSDLSHAIVYQERLSGTFSSFWKEFQVIFRTSLKKKILFHRSGQVNVYFHASVVHDLV